MCQVNDLLRGVGGFCQVLHRLVGMVLCDGLLLSHGLGRESGREHVPQPLVVGPVVHSKEVLLGEREDTDEVLGRSSLGELADMGRGVVDVLDGLFRVKRQLVRSDTNDGSCVSVPWLDMAQTDCGTERCSSIYHISCAGP